MTTSNHRLAAPGLQDRTSSQGELARGDMGGVAGPEPGSSRTWVTPTLGLLLRLGLAAVWFISGFAKASDPRETRVAVRAYQLLSPGVADVVAAVLPWLEIGAGVLLLFGLATRLAGVLSALLLIAFLIGVISAAARGLSIDCGCFGGGGQVAAGQTAYTWEIVRDSAFLLAAGYLIVRPRSWFSVDSLVGGGSRAVEEDLDPDTDPA